VTQFSFTPACEDSRPAGGWTAAAKIESIHMKKDRIGVGLAIVASIVITHAALAGEKRERANAVQVSDLPRAAQDALVGVANGANIQQIVRNPAVYTVNFTLDGIKQRFVVSEDAGRSEGPRTIKEKDVPEINAGTTIQFSDLPQPVQDLLTAKYPGAPLDQVRRRSVTYVANLERNGEKWEVRLTEDGKLMQLVNERELAEKREAVWWSSWARALPAFISSLVPCC